MRYKKNLLHITDMIDKMDENLSYIISSETKSSIIIKIEILSKKISEIIAFIKKENLLDKRIQASISDISDIIINISKNKFEESQYRLNILYKDIMLSRKTEKFNANFVDFIKYDNIYIEMLTALSYIRDIIDLLKKE
jgi:hypothetical protein